MSSHDDLINRLNSRVGKAAATVVAVDEISERHFIAEATLIAVSVFLLNKYADGFAEGLGVKQLGKEHGQLTILTFEMVLKRVSTQIDHVKGLVESISQSLRSYRDHTKAKKKAEALVSRVLSDRGVPGFEADSIAASFTDEIFKD
jgi:hypothetical protein